MSFASTLEHRLLCQFQAEKGSLERLLRVIRVRGFDVQKMELAIKDGIYHLEILVMGERCIDNLQAHVQKLVEVIGISKLPEVEPVTALERCA